MDDINADNDEHDYVLGWIGEKSLGFKLESSGTGLMASLTSHKCSEDALQEKYFLKTEITIMNFQFITQIPLERHREQKKEMKEKVECMIELCWWL